MHHVRVIAVTNQKGGVGKTTTVANLGSAVARMGKKVCLIDLDPQSHLTMHLGMEPGSGAVSMYDVLTNDVPLKRAVRQAADGLWLAPAVIDLAAAEVELVTTVGREQILRDRFKDAPPDWDCVLIDCPPSLGLLTLNALSAADEVFIPLQPHFFALQGLGKLLETVQLVQRRINPRLIVGGVILCMYESTTRLAGEVLGDLRAFLESSRNQPVPWSGAKILQTLIRRNIKLAESPSYGKTIFDYEPASHGAEDYRRLAEEFLACIDSHPPPARPPTSVVEETDVKEDKIISTITDNIGEAPPPQDILSAGADQPGMEQSSASPHQQTSAQTP